MLIEKIRKWVFVALRALLPLQTLYQKVQSTHRWFPVDGTEYCWHVFAFWCLRQMIKFQHNLIRKAEICSLAQFLMPFHMVTIEIHLDYASRSYEPCLEKAIFSTFCGILNNLSHRSLIIHFKNQIFWLVAHDKPFQKNKNKIGTHLWDVDQINDLITKRIDLLHSPSLLLVTSVVIVGVWTSIIFILLLWTL